MLGYSSAKRRVRYLSLTIIASLAGLAPAFADDASALRWGDARTSSAEEAFILAGQDPPMLEQPLLRGRLRRELLSLDSAEASRIAAELEPEKDHIAFSAATTLAGDYSGIPNRDAMITPPLEFDSSALTALGAGASTAAMSDVFSANPATADNRPFRTTETMSAALAIPSVLDIRLRFLSDPVALDFNPELRQASNEYRKGGPFDLDYAMLADIAREVDVNVPYRGIATFLSGPFELRAGRDKLQLGPGRASTLSFNAAIPWADYAKASLDAGSLSLSWYYVRLNPYLTDDERYYMDAVYKYPNLNADPTAYYELLHTEAEKNLAITRLTWRVCPWATVVFTQHDLVAGRTMQLSDLNPLMIWHNLFQEGVYGVPAMLEASVVPLKGLRLYGQYLLYDATVADETGTASDNAGASAYQGGLTWLIRPFAEDGAFADRRLRLDLEATLTDPWVYGKAYSLRQFTSRFIFVEPYNGRFWVDYPIGPAFGPDCADLDMRFGIGKPEDWQLSLTGGYRESGSITLVGYGDGSDYSHQSDFHRDGLVYVKSGQSPERRLRLGLEASSPAIRLGSFELSGKAGLQGNWLENYGCNPGDKRWWADASLAISASYGAN
jgi:hypothetical protein